MSRISTRKQAKHHEAKELLKKDVLTYDEKYFVYENYHEGAETTNGLLGAFFTPMDLASEFRMEINGHKIIDLCAGIGILSFNYLHKYFHDKQPEITCVEINPEFVEVGKKLLPEATWICADVTDPDFIASLGSFDWAYSNPPFGKINSFKSAHYKYKGSAFEYRVIEIASNLAPDGAFIIPQESAPFMYSGVSQYTDMKDCNTKYQKFTNATGIELSVSSAGTDTSFAHEQWRGVSPDVEIVRYDTFDIPVNRFKALATQTELFA